MGKFDINKQTNKKRDVEIINKFEVQTNDQVSRLGSQFPHRIRRVQKQMDIKFLVD